MFTEQKNKEPRRKSAKKKAGSSADREFDPLEEKIKGMQLDNKNSKTNNTEASKQNQATSTANGTVPPGDKRKETIKALGPNQNCRFSQHMEPAQRYKGQIAFTTANGRGLFEAATVMCNIVEITKDSTMKGKGSLQKRPIKSGSKSSLTSQGSQSGPFATMKENAEKKKKSVDEEDLE